MHNVSVKRWQDVIGPFSPAAHSIVDCGWSFVPGKLLTWKDQHGTMIEVGDLAPRAVAKMLADSLQERLWNSMLHASTTFGNIQGIPWLTPIRRLLRAQDRADWNQRHKNMLRCLASTGIWSLERLECAGYRTDGLCKYCGAPQTLHHILWECEAVGNTVAQRRELPDVILHLARDHPDWALWTTGIAKFDLTGYPRTIDDAHVHWDDVPMGRYFDAMTFGDGSGLWTSIPETRRCGWGVVSALFVDGVFRRRAAAHGPLPTSRSFL